MKSSKTIFNGANTLRVAIMAFLALAGMPLLSEPAEAACCVAYDYGDAIRGRADVEQTINSHFDTSLEKTKQDIVDALRSHADQMTANNKLLIRSNASVQNAVDAREVNRRVEDAQQIAMRTMASGVSVCNVVTGAIAGQSQAAAVARWREEVQQQQLDYFTGSSNTTASSNGTRAGLEQRLTQHCLVGATQADIDDGTCTVGTQLSSTSGSSPAGSSSSGSQIPTTTVGGDLSATTFLNAPNSSMSAEQKAQAGLFLTHAIVGTPVGGLPKGFASDDVGRRIMASRFASTARISIATAAANAIMIDRATDSSASLSSSNASGQGSAFGNSGSSTGLGSWAEGTAKQVVGYTPDASGKYFPNGISRAGVMDLRSKAWFWNPNWALSVDTHNADQNSKDIAMMMAWQVNQNNEMYRLTENISLTLAGILSILEEQNRGRVN